MGGKALHSHGGNEANVDKGEHTRESKTEGEKMLKMMEDRDLDPKHLE